MPEVSEGPHDPDEHARTLPAPVPIKAVLFPADFREALNVAGTDADPGEQALFNAAVSVFDMAHKVISAHFVPRIGQIREVLDALGEIERACLTVSSLTIARLSAPLPAENAPDALALELSRSRDPLVLALLDAASALDDGEADGRLLAQALSMIAKLGSWSGASREQFATGTTREKVSQQDPAARSRARSLGTALIETYVALSGGKVGFSRIKPETEDAGAPTGPLIRYLEHLFERARHNLSLDPERAQLSSLREWNPSLEALADWIRRFRIGGRNL